MEISVNNSKRRKRAILFLVETLMISHMKMSVNMNSNYPIGTSNKWTNMLKIIVLLNSTCLINSRIQFKAISSKVLKTICLVPPSILIVSSKIQDSMIKYKIWHLKNNIILSLDLNRGNQLQSYRENGRMRVLKYRFKTLPKKPT